MSMRKKVMAGLCTLGVGAMLTLGASQASALQTITIQVDPDGPAAANGFSDITTLDWKPGNALAADGVTAFDNFIAGAGSTQFTTYVQADLGGFQNNITNTTLNPTGFDTGGGFEWTLVAKFGEFISTGAVLPGVEFANFGLIPDDPNDADDNYLRIYYNASNDSDDLAGTGFANGTLIFEGVVTEVVSSNFTSNTGQVTNLDSFGSNDYPGVTSVVGAGATNLQAKITFAHADFFNIPAAPLGFINLTVYNTSQVLPFTQTNPSAQFYDAGTGLFGANVGATNGVTGPDFQFQVDANQAFAIAPAVPEPMTAATGLLGLGGLALAALRRRRGN